MKKPNMKKINTMQYYFNSLYWVLEQLFESQRTKLETGIGYNLRAYQKKTEYRIKHLFVALKKIINVKNSEEIVNFLRKKSSYLEKKRSKNRHYVNFSKKKYTKNLMEFVLENHCDILVESISDVEGVSFEWLEDRLLTELYEQIYKYRGILEKMIIKKYGVEILEENFYKERAITKRLKKKKRKKDIF